MFVLLHAIVTFGAVIIIAADSGPFGMTGGLGKLTLALVILAYLGTLVPTLAVQARRFHDQNKSGWLVLLNLIPYVGALIVLGFMFVGSDEGENRFGPAPR